MARRVDGVAMHGYHCSACGDWHDERPTCFRFPVPDRVAALDADQREARVELGSEQCILDGERFFLLANLDLQVQGTGEVLRWSVWTLLSEVDFERTAELWTTEGREAEPPYQGRLANSIPGLEHTLDLAVSIRTNPVGERPRIDVLSSTHRLAAWQREGIPTSEADSLIHEAIVGGSRLDSTR